jgi:diguanylate cyclase (GGDEF)-like protein/PAS domain S-box-containing protein
MVGMSRSFRPFATRGRRTIVAIVLMFALGSTASAAVSIWATGRSKNRASVVEIAARQRTLAERYVEELMLVRSGQPADPAHTASLLARSAHALLAGGAAPAVEGDDDESTLPRTTDPVVRGQLREEEKLVRDLTAAGSAFLAGEPGASIKLQGGERLATSDPLERVRVLAALTSNVSLNAARSIASRTDRNVTQSIMLQVGLGGIGIVASLLLGWALVATIRRQTAHFRSLVTSSTDLVLVLGESGCRYASSAVTGMVGHAEADLLEYGFVSFVHDDDRAVVASAQAGGAPQQLVFRVRNAAGEWRHLDAHVTDLRDDRHVRGVVLNARDITERVRLERELTRQAQRDTFGSQLVEALEMADEENAAYDVVERAMAEISTDAPMELLLSDSSRAHLERVAHNPATSAPACPVESPFSCVAVRRGSAVVFESSEALNACPKLRDRPQGPCSAVCVPISFMGRSLGVLHATGPEGVPLGGEQVVRLTTLAGQAGSRIGTVRAFEKTQLQASTDGLTGLINRRTLEAQLRTLLRQKAPFALAIADLDRFKQLNDTYGHESGDRSLRMFAQTIQRVLREVDLVARWGGEEFVVVMPGTDAEHAVTVLERVRAALADDHHGTHPAFTVSFGVSDSTMADRLDRLVQLADYALYASKNGGRDRVTIANPLWSPAELEAPNGNGRSTKHPVFHDEHEL